MAACARSGNAAGCGCGASQRELRTLFLPAANAAEAAVVEGVKVYAVGSLTEVRELLNAAANGGIHDSAL